jgi:hypothetical protein
MHSYYLKAVGNYKDMFKLMRATEKKRFNSHSYFYCVNNRIDPLTVVVDLSRVPPYCCIFYQTQHRQNSLFN